MIFPGMLRPLGDMPADLRQHVRYPEDIFDIQSRVYATYHMTNPSVFYNKEDQWQVPTLEGERNATPMQPYYTVMRLPGEKQTEFIQMLPFTPRLKDNLSAWMVARSDGAQLWQAARLSVSETEDHLRPEADRRSDQPGPEDLARRSRSGTSRARRSSGARCW